MQAIKSLRLRSRLGAVDGDKLFAVALVVVIVSAVTATVYFSFIYDPSQDIKIRDDAHLIYFKCDKCKEIFPLNKKEMTMGEIMKIAELTEGMEPRRIDCDLCKARRKAYLMTRCPNPECDKNYVLKSSRNPMGAAQYPEKYIDQCPHCQLTYLEALKAKRKALSDK